MLTACWSVKGGSGTTVVAASMTMALAQHGRRVTAADFAGDLPAALGLAEPVGPGLCNWLDAGTSVPTDGLGRIATVDDSGIAVVPRGEWVSGVGQNDLEGAARLATALRAMALGGPIVADCGTAHVASVRAFISHADRSLLVLRPCYLALRRAVAAPRPTAVVVVNEPGRSLSVRDIEDALGVPVATVIEWDPAIAHAVDTGLLRARVPRRLSYALRKVAA